MTHGVYGVLAAPRGRESAASKARGCAEQRHRPSLSVRDRPTQQCRRPGTIPDMSDLPPEIDVSRPHPARMYDYYLGGKNHLAADREAADKWIAAVPSGPVGPRENRAFLGRAVKFLAAEPRPTPQEVNGYVGIARRP